MENRDKRTRVDAVNEEGITKEVVAAIVANSHRNSAIEFNSKFDQILRSIGSKNSTVNQNKDRTASRSIRTPNLHVERVRSIGFIIYQKCAVMHDCDSIIFISILNKLY